MRSKRWPRLFGHEFDFVKWSLADVGLSTAPLAAPCAGQERAARWGTRTCHLRRLLEGRKVAVVKLIRRAAVKRTMRTPGIVKIQIPTDRAPGRAHRLIRVQIHFLVLDRLPQPLDEHVVAPAATAIHADGDAVVLEQLREFQAGELGGFNRSSQH